MASRFLVYFVFTFSLTHYSSCFSLAIDDPHKVVKVIASDGKSAETREISYTNCKVVGNGSFGVVFQARLVGSQKESDDIAIKKVLQDKRFKVIFSLPSSSPLTAHPHRLTPIES
jgi:hypothetical protein